MTPSELFNNVALTSGDCVDRIVPSQLTNATPCSEWNLKQLLNHVVYELLWIPDLLAGKTVAEVGTKYDGDVLGEDYKAAWQKALEAAQAAIAVADMDALVHLSYGEVPARDYVTEMASDILVHGWDIGQSIQCSELFDEAAVQAVYDYILPRVEDYRQAGIISAPVAVSADAPLLHKLLGMMGRNPRKI